MNPDEKVLDDKVQERFDQLPKVIQDAITSADVEKRMRVLADTNKLHLDQWDKLEKEVQLALLGFEPIEDLEKNIKSELGISDEVAKALTADISKIVFEPIRQELERQLEHPEAKAQQLTGVEQARSTVLGAEGAPPAPAATIAPAVAPIAPATPPPAPNELKVERAPVTETYRPGQISSERKEIHEDPYREPPA